MSNVMSVGEKPLVIVLSRNYSTGLGIIRSLGAAGYTVDMVASTKKKGSSIIASCSKYVRNSVEVISPKIQGDSGYGLIQALMKYNNEDNGRIILFPADDFTASVVDTYRDILKENFVIPSIRREDTESMVSMMDKTVQGEMARKAGIMTPLEWIIPLQGEIVIPEDMVFPCFIKPLQSITGHKTEMAVCHSKQELEEHLVQMREFYCDRSVLVQEYLDIDKEYDLSGVCLDQEVIIPALIEKTRVARHELGVTMSGKMVPVDVLGDTINRIIDLMKQFRYTGMFDLELNLCNGRLYFNEVNLRSGGPNFSYYLNGVNLPDIYVRAVTGSLRNPENEKVKELGRTFVYEKVAWEDYINGYMSRQELKECIDGADFTLLACKDDPAPGRCFYRRIRLSALKHRVRRLMGIEKEAEDTGRPCVVVTGRNYCNILAMSRALGKAGYDVEVLRIFKTKPGRFKMLRRMKPGAHSRYVRAYHECIADNDAGCIADWLISNSAGNPGRLLMPSDDYSAWAADEKLDELRKFYVVPSIADEAGAISRLMDKNEQKKLAAAFNLPMLQSTVIKSEGGHYEIPAGIVFPCFIKPNISMNSTKAKMRKCSDMDELAEILNGYAASGDFEILAEEYADIKNEYSLLGVSTSGGIAAPCLFRTVRGGHRERKGVALMGETMPCEGLKAIIDKCCRFIKSLDYTGLFDADFIETADGEIYFIELNFRAGASMHAFTETGVNLPGMFADNVIKGVELKENCVVAETGKLFISEKVLMEEYARNDASKAEIKNWMNEADIHFVKDDNDPGPYKYFRRFYAVAGLMRVLYRVRDKRDVENVNVCYR